MAELLTFPNKNHQKPEKKSQGELVEAFSTRLTGIMSAICFANHYDDVPIGTICRAMTKNMVEDDFEYTEAVLNNMLDDPEIRARVESVFLKILRDGGHIK